EFSTTVRARPSAIASRDHSTGAAWTRLAVNTAAAVSRGPSLTTRARSAAPVDFRPAGRPTARKPRGRVSDTGAPGREVAEGRWSRCRAAGGVARGGRRGPGRGGAARGGRAGPAPGPGAGR